MEPKETLILLRNDLNGFQMLKPLKNGSNDELSLDKKHVRCIEKSNCGKLLAYCDSKSVFIWSNDDKNLINQFIVDNVQFINLSPLLTHVQVWKHTISGDANNHFIYDLRNGKLVSECRQKQSQWRFQWSKDEKICCRPSGGEIHCYADNAFERFIQRFNAQRVMDFSFTTNERNGLYYLICFSLGVKGQPNFLRLYKYPNFDNVLANRSFYRTDSVSFSWNSKGNACLILCTADHDNTGKSYYGEQTLQYMDLEGKSYGVKLSKEGPIHSAEWCPGTDKPCFCVIYGFVPSKASLYDSNATMLHDFGEITANQILFNRFGNLLAMSGFGNLSGQIFMFDVKKRKLIAKFMSSNSTYIEWAPDGEHLLTGTTSPRMMVSNGYKIWHYTGKLLHEYNYEKEAALANITWKPMSQDAFSEPVLPESLANVDVKIQDDKMSRYIPPAFRQGGLPVIVPEGISKKHKTKRPNGNKKPVACTNEESKKGDEAVVDEKTKKIKALTRKINEIKKLKAKRDKGGNLEIDQVSKIEKEAQFVKELEQLHVS